MTKPRPAEFKWRQFEPPVILMAVGWYLRFSRASITRMRRIWRAFCAGAFLMDFLAGYPVLPTQNSILSRPHAMALVFGGSDECGRSAAMQLETKFLRLRTPVTIGSRFGDWEVCWIGGWARDRLSYLVMVVKLEPRVGTSNALILA